MEQENPPPPATGRQQVGQVPYKQEGLLLRPSRPTNALVWCFAIFCSAFSLLLILTGVITLIVFLAVKPRHPSFDIANASLSSIYIDSPGFLNGELFILANFTNPNQRINMGFEYLNIELLFHGTLIAARAIKPFGQRSGESRLQTIQMVSRGVPLPSMLLLELQRQVRNNRIQYEIRGNFKTRAGFGLSHITYWITRQCFVELTSPPNGVLVGRICTMN
ncbi:uncharacterized protein LOC116248501 [Nymphaea colorata]|uniref:uncharacterized protein LOC116248501 n=1 Tax=Nymphaea colorata TaxID=210225 RepID=UPI00129DE895|nr:uncharacterized protein LOC116248501 [Nymphaea colorata]XP_049932057.1 uncharacterized protein LOC116248501 [Nymphaea colorata]